MKNGISKWLLSTIIIFSFYTVDAQENHYVNYQRSSVIHMMIEHPMYMFNDEIANAFRRIPIPDRFNDHNLGVKVVKFATQEFSDQTDHIYSFINQTNLGSKAVAKWFNWNKQTGSFNMELVKERGIYNSTNLDRELAILSARGSAILSDAGENLIPNTYLIMSDICYKGEYSNKQQDFEKTGKYRRFDVKIVSYIYKLDWTDEDLNVFYSTYYKGSLEFTQKSHYGFTFKAKVETDYGESSKSITQSALIEKVVARCLDINMVKLQRAYPDFKAKSVITSTEPLQADVGLKEGVTPDCLFEVLEQVVDDNGIITYNHVGIVKPVDGKICDNRYVPDEEMPSQPESPYTTFKIVNGNDFYPGMLIREIEY